MLAAGFAVGVLYLSGVSFGCSSTSCQTAPISPVGTPAGTATLDVWANYTGGSYHFSKTAPLALAASILSIGGHDITAITVRLALSITGAQPSGYSGSLLIYTCSACGDQQASLGTVQITGAVSEGVLQVSSFPTLSPSSNITILVWPDEVSVTLASGQKLVLGMSPVSVSNVAASSPMVSTSAASVACPATLPEYTLESGALVQTGTASLVSFQQAVDYWYSQGTLTVNSTAGNVGLLATYYLNGPQIQNVIVPGLGGTSGSTYGLLSGYHYNSDGSCSS